MREPRRLIPRHALPSVVEALAYARVVVINGPRQAGKTTLARLVCRDIGGTFVSLDDRTAREAATRDPVGFLDQPRPLVIDEVQRGGNDLLLAIKAAVDRDERPGRFILTGSTRFLTVPSLSESLAGRVDIVDLWPLSQGEIEGVSEGFADRLFTEPDSLASAVSGPTQRRDCFERVCRGGFPALLDAPAGARRRWFANYVRTVTQRDIRDFARPRRIEELPRVLRLLAARTAQELNVSGLASELEIPRTTLADYLSLLETVFLFHRLPAWSRNLTSKVVRHPKAHIVDTGLAARLIGVNADHLARPTSTVAGALLESFVAGEIGRQATWNETEVQIHHFRDRDGAEVDLVLETSDARVAGIQVTAAGSVSGRAFRSLQLLRDRLGAAFVHGVVLYTGPSAYPFGDGLSALPLSVLWAAR